MNAEGATTTPPDNLLRVRQYIPEYTRPDGSKNTRGLATATGFARSTITRYLAKIEAEDREAAQTNYTPDIDGIEETKPRVRVRAYNVSVTRDLPFRRVIGIGDTHVSPGMDLTHFSWIGRHVAESKPDNVVHFGDFLDFESCEFHSAPGSASQKHRPSFSEDIEAGYDALELYHKEVGVGEIPHDELDGNHEYRVERYEEMAPTLAGTMVVLREQMFARYRWRTTPYRQWLFIEGVGMTHVPHNIMNKPVGGRYPENTIGNQSTHSICSAHTHRFNHVTVPKIGVNNSITITNVGSAMPWGYVAKYAAGATTGLTYGIVEMKMRGGRVEDCAMISMLELERRYK